MSQRKNCKSGENRGAGTSLAQALAAHAATFKPELPGQPINLVIAPKITTLFVQEQDREMSIADYLGTTAEVTRAQWKRMRLGNSLKKQYSLFPFPSDTQISLGNWLEIDKKATPLILVTPVDDVRSDNLYINALAKQIEGGPSSSASSSKKEKAPLEMDRIREQLETLTAKVEELSTDNERLTAKVEELSTDNERLTAKVELLKEQIDDLREKSDAVKAVLDSGWAAYHRKDIEELEEYLLQKGKGVEIPAGLNRRQTLQFLADRNLFNDFEKKLMSITRKQFSLFSEKLHHQ